MTDRLPDRPSERQVVVVLDPVEADRSLFEDVRDVALESHVAVLSSQPDHKLADSLTRTLERRHLLEPGSVLLQSPYHPGNYSPAEDSAEAFAVEKFAAFSRLCQFLGAKTVEVKALQEMNSRESVRLNAEAGYLPTAGKGSVEKQALEEMAIKLSWSDRFGGAEPNIAGAEEYLSSLALEVDPVMSSLIESRADGHNPHRKRSVTVDLSREGTRIMNAAAGINLRAVKVKADLARVAKSAHRYQVTYEVTF